MSTTRKQLETAAIQAHRRGDDWKTFWPTVAADVSAMEPWDRDAFHKLVRRLSYLLTCGDCDGVVPVGDGDPWEADDVPQYPASDNATAACVNWTAAGVSPVRFGRQKGSRRTMSRGLGKVERRILEAMSLDDDSWRCLGSLKNRVWGQQENHTRGGRIVTLRYWQNGQQNHHFAFRRALDRLTAKGLLEMRLEDMTYPSHQRRQPRRECRITQGGKCELLKLHTYANPSVVEAST